MLAVSLHKLDIIAHVIIQKKHITSCNLLRRILEKRFKAWNICRIQKNTGETIYCASFWLFAFVTAVKKMIRDITKRTLYIRWKSHFMRPYNSLDHLIAFFSFYERNEWLVESEIMDNINKHWTIGRTKCLNQ